MNTYLFQMAKNDKLQVDTINFGNELVTNKYTENILECNTKKI